jgi:hypothetical protein
MPKKILISIAVAMLFAAPALAHAANGDAVNAADGATGDQARSEAVARYTQEIINRMDADSNGEVSKEEFMAFMSKEFDRLDVNHDGKLMQNEILNKGILSIRTGLRH